MRSDLDAALDRCLSGLAAGESLDTCLARHPEHAAQLRPLLQLAAEIHHVSTPMESPAARAAGRDRVLAAAVARSQSTSRFVTLWRRTVASMLTPAWRPVAVALGILLAAALAFMLAVSTTALPGDDLYSIKLARQEVYLALTFDPAKEQILAGQFATQRRLDVGIALSQGRSADVGFKGILESIQGERWIVSSLPVVISGETHIEGEPYHGAPVEVEGELVPAGYVRAVSVSIDPDHAPWPDPIRTTTLTPTATATAVPAATATPIPATATSAPTGTATSSPTITPSATASAKPTGTPAPLATATRAATATHAPTATDAAAATPTTQWTLPPVAPSPTGTAESPERPHPTHTPRPSDTPRLTDTPRPTETPWVTDTPRPSETPEPTETAKPTETPQPTPTPEPDEEDDD